MDIKHLEVFNEICKHKGFSNAAKKLNISQPTVSTHIKSLEESIGLQLFKRKNKNMGNLTDAGEILYHYSRQIFSLTNEAESILKHFKQGSFGILSLATSHTFCNWYLPDILKEFKQKYSLVEIILHTEYTPKIIDMVNNREVQFGIIRTGSPIFTNPNVKSELIGQDYAVFVVSAAHKFLKNKSVSLDDVINEPFIAFGKKSNYYWDQVLNTFTNTGAFPNISMELNDIQAVKKMIEINMGISILPFISIQDELKAGKLKIIQVKYFPSIIRYTHLIYQKDIIKSGSVESFNSFIEETKPYSLTLKSASV